MARSTRLRRSAWASERFADPGDPSGGAAEKGGAKGFMRLLRTLQGGDHVALTADIPKVSRVAGLGVVMLAKFSGRPIYPIALATHWRKELNNWDRSTINYPFGRGAGILGAPIRVVSGADNDELEQPHGRRAGPQRGNGACLCARSPALSAAHADEFRKENPRVSISIAKFAGRSMRSCAVQADPAGRSRFSVACAGGDPPIIGAAFSRASNMADNLAVALPEKSRAEIDAASSCRRSEQSWPTRRRDRACRSVWARHIRVAGGRFRYQLRRSHAGAGGGVAAGDRPPHFFCRAPRNWELPAIIARHFGWTFRSSIGRQTFPASEKYCSKRVPDVWGR